ncbi:hypothetical protein ACPA9J_09865 [Pseudomonas aeruginosa]
MDVMRTGASVLGTLEPAELRPANSDFVRRPPARRLPGDHDLLVPLHHEGQRIDCNSDEPTIGGHFLALLHGKPSELHVVMSISLILYAEHEFNAHPPSPRGFAPRPIRPLLLRHRRHRLAARPLHGGANGRRWN